jgi:hypothetical protein
MDVPKIVPKLNISVETKNYRIAPYGDSRQERCKGEI